MASDFNMLEGLKRNLESLDFFFATFLPLFAWKERAVLVQCGKGNASLLEKIG